MTDTQTTMKAAVLGAGSWGTTLAIVLSENGHEVRLWEYFPDRAEAISRDRENKRFLPGVAVPEVIEVTSDMARALDSTDLVLFVVPSHTTRSTAQAARKHWPGNRTIVVNASKGLEEETLDRLSVVIQSELGVDPGSLCSLMGPSHAEEVSRRMPTSIVAAAQGPDVAERAQVAFTRPYLRVYTNPDPVGVEIAVSLKNCIAIAAGVCDGLGYGDNTKAALLTRGLAEIRRLGDAMGARPETFAGLAGVGDLVVTCLSRHSRNRHVGQKIGEGQELDQVLSEMVMVAEGVRTTRAAVELGRRNGVELPIIESVYGILFDSRDPRDEINQLMTRPLGPELPVTGDDGSERR